MIKKLWLKATRHYAGVKRNEDRLDQVRRDSTQKLHLGCGKNYRNGYVNVDAYSDVADIRDNIIHLDSFLDEAVDLIETHHVLEHLSFAEAEQALQVWARKLKSGGRLIISVPDVEGCFALWRRSSSEYRWNHVIQMIYGSQEHTGMFHKSGYTPERLGELLVKKGFDVELVMREYPQRPTPSFLVMARKGRPAN